MICWKIISGCAFQSAVHEDIFLKYLLLGICFVFVFHTSKHSCTWYSVLYTLYVVTSIAMGKAFLGFMLTFTIYGQLGNHRAISVCQSRWLSCWAWHWYWCGSIVITSNSNVGTSFKSTTSSAKLYIYSGPLLLTDITWIIGFKGMNC